MNGYVYLALVGFRLGWDLGGFGGRVGWAGDDWGWVFGGGVITVNFPQGEI